MASVILYGYVMFGVCFNNDFLFKGGSFKKPAIFKTYSAVINDIRKTELKLYNLGCGVKDVYIQEHDSILKSEYPYPY